MKRILFITTSVFVGVGAGVAVFRPPHRYEALPFLVMATLVFIYALVKKAPF